MNIAKGNCSTPAKSNGKVGARKEGRERERMTVRRERNRFLPFDNPAWRNDLLFFQLSLLGCRKILGDDMSYSVAVVVMNVATAMLLHQCLQLVS